MLGGILLFESTLNTTLNTKTLLLLLLLLLLIAASILLLFACQYLSKKRFVFTYAFGVVVPILFFLLGYLNTLLHAVPLATHSEIISYLATIESDPIFKPHNKTFQYDVVLYDSLTTSKIKVFQKVEGDSLPLQYGDLIIISGRIISPDPISNRYVFDYGEYLRRNGFQGTMFLNQSESPQLLESSYKKGLIPQLRYFRILMKHKILDSTLSNDSKALVIALLFGSKEFIRGEIKESFSAVGVSHVLALSGLHVGLIYSILALFINLLLFFSKYKKRSSLILGVGILWVFALFTGASPSVVRATLFFTIYALGALLKRRIYGIQVLINTAFIMLLINPYWLFDLGFQFSFCAVLSIIKFAPIINKLYRAKSTMGRYIYNICNMSISAQLGTLPLILYYFGYFPIYFLLANLIVIPLITAILYAGVLFITLEMITPSFNYLKCFLDLLSRCLTQFVDWIAQISTPSQNQYISLLASIIISILVVQLYRIIKKYSFIKVIHFQLLCMVLIFLPNLQNSNKDTVYISSINGNLLVHQINQSKVSVASPTPYLTFGKVDSTFHKYWIIKGFKPPKAIYYPPYKDEDMYVDNEIIFLQSGESIYIPKKRRPLKFEVDYLYLNSRNINSCNLKDLKFKAIICHNSISANLKNGLKQFSKAKNIEIIDLQDKAYITLLP